MNETLSTIIDGMLHSQDPGDVRYILTVLGCILGGDKEGAKQLIGAYVISS